MKEDNSIDNLLNRFPTANLIKNELVIHKLHTISKQTGYNIYILRDDLTGFGIGGNKTRKLDYLMGDALAKKADTLVTLKATSFSRNAAFAARNCGLQLHVVIPECEHAQNQNSQNLFKHLDTNLHYISDNEDVLTYYKTLVNTLRNEGKNVYELHPGGSDSIGALSYFNVFNQIVKYSQRTNINFSDIILSTGSAGTQAGLILGQYITDYNVSIVGITAKLEVEKQYELIYELIISTCRMLNIPIADFEINLDDRYIGPGYAIPSEQGDNANKAFACKEGILLDQVYTAKAAAALLKYSKDRRFRGENILFLHTGGNSGLYY